MVQTESIEVQCDIKERKDSHEIQIQTTNILTNCQEVQVNLHQSKDSQEIEVQTMVQMEN